MFLQWAHVIHLSFVFLSTVMLMFQTSPLEFGLPSQLPGSVVALPVRVLLPQRKQLRRCLLFRSLDSLERIDVWLVNALHWHCAHVILFSKVYGFYGSMFYTRYSNINRGELSAMGLLSFCQRLLPFGSLFLLPLEFAPEVPPFAVLVLVGLLLRLPRMQLNTL